jgi:hypothetical protein
MIPASHFLEFTGAKPPKSKWKFTKAGKEVQQTRRRACRRLGRSRLSRSTQDLRAGLPELEGD